MFLIKSTYIDPFWQLYLDFDILAVFLIDFVAMIQIQETNLNWIFQLKFISIAIWFDLKAQVNLIA